MKRVVVILVGLCACMALGMQQRQLVPVISADKALCLLPYPHIAESETLQKLFLEEQDNKNNPLCTLSLPSVSCQKLDLFSQALDQPLATFENYFKSLTPEQQRTLIVAAGKHSEEGKQLNAKALAAQLFSVCYPPEIIEQQICPCIDLTDFIDHLAKTVLGSNVTDAHTTHETITDEHSCFVYDECGLCGGEIPSSLQQLMKCGDSFSELLLTDGEHSYKKEYHKRRSDASCSYIITSSNDVSDNPASPYLKRIWLTSDTGTHLATTLSHPYDIDFCSFSHNGHFLASYSNHGEWRTSCGERHANESCIMLTALGTQSDGFDFFHTALEGYEGNPIDIAFNPQSTLVAASTSNGVYIWDTQGIFVKHLIDNDYSLVTSIKWSNDGSILYALTMQPLSTRRWIRSRKLILYDIHKRTHVTIPIVSHYAQDFLLFSHHNMIIIPLQEKIPLLHTDSFLYPLLKDFPKPGFDYETGGLLLCNATTGAYISFIPLSVGDDGYYALNSKGTLLATVVTDKSKSQSIVLCDLTSDKQTIVLEKLVDVKGVVFSQDECSVIILYNDNSYTVSDLWDEFKRACLDWFKEKPTLLQRYALQRMYRALLQLDERLALHPKSLTLQALEALPTEPHNIKQFLKQQGLF